MGHTKDRYNGAKIHLLRVVKLLLIIPSLALALVAVRATCVDGLRSEDTRLLFLVLMSEVFFLLVGNKPLNCSSYMHGFVLIQIESKQPLITPFVQPLHVPLHDLIACSAGDSSIYFSNACKQASC